MINVNKLFESKRVEITVAEIKIDNEFVKKFRKDRNLTQVALANIMGVTKKTIEKWEQGKNNINGSSAVLFKLLNDNPELLGQLYSVKIGVEGKDGDFKPIESKVITATKFEIIKPFNLPLVAAVC